MAFFSKDIGIDLGTVNTLVYVKGKGIVIREPSVVAVDIRTDEVLAVGNLAREMIGRTPGSIVALRPLTDGVIADFSITAEMLKHFIRNAVQSNLFSRPRVIICIPSGVTEVERRAVENAARQAGGGVVDLIEEPMAAALGAGLPVAEATGSMVIDIGGGTTDIAVISLGDIVISRSVRKAGDAFNAAILSYVKRKYNLLIGERSAEDLKISAGSAFPFHGEKPVAIKGRNLVDGLPKNVVISGAEVREALAEPLADIVEAVKQTLGETPPERHSRPRHHAHRRRRAAARSGQAAFTGNRNARQRRRASPRLRRRRHRQNARHQRKFLLARKKLMNR